MIFINFEYLFIISLAGLYIYDSATVCFYNSIFILKGIRKKFDYQIPHSQFNFGKKFLIFLQILSPHILVFQTSWQYKTIHTKAIDIDINNIQKTAEILRKIQPIIIFLFVLMFIVMPILILFKFKTLLIILTILSIYLINIFLFIFILINRKKLHLSKKLILQILLDSLFCPPFALNLMKKISLNLSTTSDALALSKSLLNESRQKLLVNQVVSKIEILQSQYDPQDNTYIALETKKNNLMNEK